MSKQHKPRRSKVRPVAVAQMRVPPALVTQRPFKKSQAEEYAANFDTDKFGFPIMNLRTGVYWICDGQHRIAAWKIFIAPGDPGCVDCEVYENLTDAEMAEIFLGRDQRRAVAPFVKFHIACTAERPRECDIRRVVETCGLKIGREREEKNVGAVGSLGKVYDNCGPVVLGQTLRTIDKAYSGDPVAFDGRVIEGLSMFFNRYNGRTNEKDLAAALSQTQHGVLGLLRRAESQRERTGNSKIQCLAATAVEIYNKTVPRQKRLPSWWKAAE